MICFPYLFQTSSDIQNISVIISSLYHRQLRGQHNSIKIDPIRKIDGILIIRLHWGDDVVIMENCEL